MREVMANGYVSYIGTYDFVHGKLIDFSFDAKPQRPDQTLSLTCQDRMWLVK